jgi:hypothetical protein
MDIVNSKATRWAELWRCEKEHRQPAWWEDLRRLAGEQEREPITLEDLQSGFKCFKAVVGLGIDKQNPRWWRDLPEAGHDALCRLLNQVEESLTWPSAMRQCLVALLPKTTSADRPITLTPGLYRLWSRVRRSSVAAWTSQWAAHWDMAVAGSSPLRAAIMRQLRLEVASALGMSWAEMLWDISKFYDAVDLATVARVGADLQYPLTELLLGLQMATAPRRIRAG